MSPRPSPALTLEITGPRSSWGPAWANCAISLSARLWRRHQPYALELLSAGRCQLGQSLPQHIAVAADAGVRLVAWRALLGGRAHSRPFAHASLPSAAPASWRTRCLLSAHRRQRKFARHAMPTGRVRLCSKPQSSIACRTDGEGSMCARAAHSSRFTGQVLSTGISPTSPK